MIYGSNILVQTNGPRQTHPASLAKSNDAATARSKASDTISTKADLDSAEWTRTAPADQASPLVDKQFPAGLPPIADQVQAAEATQHVLTLMRAQPLVALKAQANTSSQSVERLLQ